uniref:Uncharacterized protein n=1 Tax=Vitrella brassicaformis TaxID=1169539 RepID=A0A7S1P0R8_9ALVE|mmetsp:Transcript_21550/g.52808  ORF Transcript_21550/g.52808 Transcript_21550/m.52808 type:complete len:126 (+) Transcript_21550:1660-2037(+)
MQRCIRGWTFCPPETAGQTGSNCVLHSSQRDLIRKADGSTFSVSSVGRVRRFIKHFPVLSADREDIDRAIEMAVEYREWAREKVRSLKLEAEAAKAKDRADEGGPARGTRAGKRKREQEVPTEDD